MIYKYTAINSSGTTVSGQMEADTREAAEQLIEARDELLTSIRQAGTGGAAAWSGYLASFRRVRVEDLVMFTRQLAMMFRMGVPLLRSLDILRQQTEHPALRKAIGQIHSDVEGGGSLSHTFRKHPRVFPPLYCSMLAAGELSGSLADILSRLGDVLSHEARIRKSVRSAVQYPALVMGALGVAFVVLLTFVIPQFAPMFEQAGAALPLPTQICMQLSSFLIRYGAWLLLGLGGAAAAAVVYFKKEHGRLQLDQALLRLPLVGRLLVSSCMARFAGLFAMMQHGGVPVLDIVRILQQCIGNKAIEAELVKIETKLSEGAGISAPLLEARYFTRMMVNMVAVGEESGRLDEMLDEVSRHYDEEVEFSVKKLIGAMGSTLTILIAIMVGFFALAVYLPMWNMTDLQMGQ